jgi:hypothetical protein
VYGCNLHARHCMQSAGMERSHQSAPIIPTLIVFMKNASLVHRYTVTGTP